MNIVTSVNDIRVLAESTLKEKGYEIDFGVLKKGTLDGLTVISKDLDCLPDVEDIRPMVLGDRFYEVNIETLDAHTRKTFFSDGKRNTERLSAVIVGQIDEEVRFVYGAAILGVMNTIGEMVRYNRYGDIFINEDECLESYLDFKAYPNPR